MTYIEECGMLCPKCGKQTDDTGKFCQWCGADLSAIPRKPLLRRRTGPVADEYAGLTRRFVAFLIDLLFIIVIDLFITGLFGLSEGARMIYQYARHMPMTDKFGQTPNALIPVPIILTIGILVILVPWLYFAALESSKNQATLGKIALRLAVTDMQGNRITFARATLRHFFKFLSAVLVFAGFIMIPLTSRKQGLHDIIAGCLMFLQR